MSFFFPVSGPESRCGGTRCQLPAGLGMCAGPALLWSGKHSLACLLRGELALSAAAVPHLG